MSRTRYRIFENGYPLLHDELWQEGSHPQQIQSDEIMVQKLEYIHANPIRRGYVDDAIHWRYSSARDYAGRAGLLRIQVY